MNFFGVLLYPFTLLYDLITRFRNYLYDTGYKRSFDFQTNVIAVGNLAVGGTGKSPMVEYIIRLLGDRKIVTLSRGYGRSTRGFRIATDKDTPETIGDEPCQFFKKFSHIHVAVGEQRAVAIPFILAELPETEVILLDDAYQHRPVKPGVNILLTDYSRPFFKDFVLPSGRLRESRKGARRADVVVVTKCPDRVDVEYFTRQIRKYNDSAHIAFAFVKYMNPRPVTGSRNFTDKVFLFSGIANPASLRSYAAKKWQLIGERHFPDHHKYTERDIRQLREQFEGIEADNKCLLTTEKDMVKLHRLLGNEEFRDFPVFYIPIETVFLEGGKRFEEIVLNSLHTYSDY